MTTFAVVTHELKKKKTKQTAYFCNLYGKLLFTALIVITALLF